MSTTTTAPADARSPSDVTPVSGDVRLVHIRPTRPQVYPVPIILVPSLLSRYYVLDLHPRRSMAGFLRDHGFDVYLIDWGDPPGRVGPDFDTYVDDYLAGAIEMAAEASESGRTSVLGYSLGGVLSVVCAALYPHSILNYMRRNAFAAGEHVVKGRRVELRDVKVPIFVAMADQDHIVPAGQALAVEELVGSTDVTTEVLHAGHVGLMAGRAASEIVWPRVSEWLGSRSGQRRRRKRG